MNKFITIGRLFIAVALIAFGIQHFIYLEFITRAFPVIPLWVPGHGILACIFGALILLMFLLFLFPMLVINFKNGLIWTNTGKALVLAGANFLVAATFPASYSNPASYSKNGFMLFLQKLIPLGRYFLIGFFILAGTLHFIYAPYVATLIPAWIPAHLFWTYFTGVALIAAAIGMLIPRTIELAATLSALMIFLWVVLLHFPRATYNLHDANETTAFFEALAMCGMAILIAINARQKKKSG